MMLLRAPDPHWFRPGLSASSVSAPPLNFQLFLALIHYSSTPLTSGDSHCPFPFCFLRKKTHALFLVPGERAHRLCKEVPVLQSVGVWGKETTDLAYFFSGWVAVLGLLLVFVFVHRWGLKSLYFTDTAVFLREVYHIFTLTIAEFWEKKIQSEYLLPW